jgi:hypothetical protein
MKLLTIAAALLLIIMSCKKNGNSEVIDNPNKKYCWVTLDVQLIILDTICDKTAAEIAMIDSAGFYYRQDEPLKCWYKASTNQYAKDLPQSIITKFFGAGYTVVNCGYCASWYLREKRRYLPTNSITYSPVTFKRFCGDTVATLFRGREIPLRQTVDSVIVTQFSDNGTNW